MTIPKSFFVATVVAIVALLAAAGFPQVPDATGTPNLAATAPDRAVGLSGPLEWYPPADATQVTVLDAVGGLKTFGRYQSDWLVQTFIKEILRVPDDDDMETIRRVLLLVNLNTREGADRYARHEYPDLYPGEISPERWREIREMVVTHYRFPELAITESDLSRVLWTLKPTADGE